MMLLRLLGMPHCAALGSCLEPVLLDRYNNMTKIIILLLLLQGY